MNELLLKIYDMYVVSFEKNFTSEELEYLSSLLETVPHYRLGNFNLEEHIQDRDNLARKVYFLPPVQKVFLEIFLKN